MNESPKGTPRLQTGFAHLILIAVIAVFIIGLATGFLYSNKPQNNATETPTPTSEPTDTPQAQTGSPTPTPTNVFPPSIPPTSTPSPQSCDKFNPEDGLATITLKLKEKNGQPLTGNWYFKMYAKLPCPAKFPGAQNYYSDYIREGEWSYTTLGFSPGTVRIDVDYHQTGQAFDVEATAGNHIIEAIVEN